jgi:hypothetical protein
MRRVKVLSVFVLLALVLSATITTGMGQGPQPGSPAKEDQLSETGAIRSIVEQYFDAKLQVRLGKADAVTLERFFDQANSDGVEALRRETTKALGFFERTEKVGPPVQSGRVEVEILIRGVEGPTADVAVREALSYTILHPTLGVRQTEEVFDHILHLVLENDQWLIARDDYFDPGGDAMFSRGDFAAPGELGSPDNLDPPPPLDQGIGEGVPHEGRARYDYNRSMAYTYAESYWDIYNPWFRDLCPSGGDCANFASQVVLAGGYPKQWSGSRKWWYDNKGTPNTGDDTWSSSWVNVWPQQLALDYWYGAFVTSAKSLKVGDLVYMDWEGNGSWDHVAIVVVADPVGGNPLLNAHCNDRHQKSLSWFGAATNYYFVVFDTVWLSQSGDTDVE